MDASSTLLLHLAPAHGVDEERLVALLLDAHVRLGGALHDGIARVAAAVAALPFRVDVEAVATRHAGRVGMRVSFIDEDAPAGDAGIDDGQALDGATLRGILDASTLDALVHALASQALRRALQARARAAGGTDDEADAVVLPKAHARRALVGLVGGGALMSHLQPAAVVVAPIAVAPGQRAASLAAGAVPTFESTSSSSSVESTALVAGFARRAGLRPAGTVVAHALGVHADLPLEATWVRTDVPVTRADLGRGDRDLVVVEAVMPAASDRRALARALREAGACAVRSSQVFDDDERLAWCVRVSVPPDAVDGVCALFTSSGATLLEVSRVTHRRL